MSRTVFHRATWLLSLGMLCLAHGVAAADYKMCYLLYSNVDDLGYSFSLNSGRLNAKSTLEGLHPTKTFETLAIPNIYAATATQELRDKTWAELLAAGCNVIVASGCGSLDGLRGCTIAVTMANWYKRAIAYPHIQFIIMWDDPAALTDHTYPNLHFFIMDFTPAYFLAGVAAATQATKCVSMMYPFDTNRNSHDAASGFVLGVQYAKPTLPVHLLQLTSYAAPAKEILVTTLFQDNYGCDVTARYSDPRDADVFVQNRNNGKLSVGSHIDLQRYVGDSVLISAYGSWDKVVVPLIDDWIRYGAVKTTRFPLVYGTASGAMAVSSASPRSKSAVQAAVDAAAATIAVNDTVICGVQKSVLGTAIVNDPTTGCRNRTERLPGPIKTSATIYHGAFFETTMCGNGSYGTYNTETTIKLVCAICPENTFALNGATKCTPCIEGLIAPPNSTFCYAPTNTQTDATPIIASVATIGGVCVFLIVAVIARQRYVGWKKNQKAPRQPPMCLMFTDVEGSTDLWNQYPEAMAQAMTIHHATIRHVIEENGAYEIKTIGDAFMIACERTIDGISLAVEIQRALQAAEWPTAFQTKGPWNGLKVRIGVHHCTEIEIKYETVHNYYDYYGNDVNITARVEAFTQGGQICVTQNTWREVVDNPDFESVIADDVEVNPWAKDVQLKGIDGGFTMYSIVPRELSARAFQPVTGHENDFAGTTQGSDSHSCSRSTTSSIPMDDVNHRLYTAVIDNAFLNLSPPIRRQMISAMSRDLSLQVITNQRRAIHTIAVELARRAGVQQAPMTVDSFRPPRKVPSGVPPTATGPAAAMADLPGVPTAQLVEDSSVTTPSPRFLDPAAAASRPHA